VRRGYRQERRAPAPVFAISRRSGRAKQHQRGFVTNAGMTITGPGRSGFLVNGEHALAVNLGMTFSHVRGVPTFSPEMGTSRAS